MKHTKSVQSAPKADKINKNPLKTKCTEPGLVLLLAKLTSSYCEGATTPPETSVIAPVGKVPTTLSEVGLELVLETRIAGENIEV
jgi:hypothetical protein